MSARSSDTKEHKSEASEQATQQLSTSCVGSWGRLHLHVTSLTEAQRILTVRTKLELSVKRASDYFQQSQIIQQHYNYYVLHHEVEEDIEQNSSSNTCDYLHNLTITLLQKYSIILRGRHGDSSSKSVLLWG
jgi:hypothetical protein